MLRKPALAAKLFILLMLASPLAVHSEDPAPAPTPKPSLGGGFGEKAERAGVADEGHMATTETLNITNLNIHEYASQGKINTASGADFAWSPPGNSRGARGTAADARPGNQLKQVESYRKQYNYQRDRCRELSRSIMYDQIEERSRGSISEKWLSDLTSAYSSLKPTREKYFQAGMDALAAENEGKAGSDTLPAKRRYWQDRERMMKDEVAFWQSEVEIGGTLAEAVKAPRHHDAPLGRSCGVTGSPRAWINGSIEASMTKKRIGIAKQRFDAAKRHFSRAQSELKTVYRLAGADGGVPGWFR
ncbi:MAG: hypothetical protein GY906_02585 [bacterium]|nr:hypothetical protein [bacterium]